MTIKLVELKIPVTVYAVLAAQAYATGQTVTAMLEGDAYARTRNSLTDRFRACYDQGMTVTELCVALDLTRRQVHYHLRRAKLPAHRKPKG